MDWRGLSQEDKLPLPPESAFYGGEEYTFERPRRYFAPKYAVAIPGIIYADIGVISLRFTPSGSEVYVPFVPPPPPALAFAASVPQIIAPAPWPKTQVWRVVHYNHNDEAIGDCFPSDTEFALYLGKVGYLNYSLDTNHELARRATTEPYATDFKLYRGDKPVMGGLHTSVEIDPSVESRSFQISSKDWMHYFETQFWPFDPDNPTQDVYLATDRDVYLVLKDIFDKILSYPYTPTFTYNFGTQGILIDFKIEPNDTEAILSKVTTLGQRNPGSFDLEVTHDREINLYAPKKGVKRVLVLEQGSNIYHLGYTNEGPKGTHILATAHMTSNSVGAVIDHPNIAKYRRLMVNAELPDIADANLINPLAAGEAERAATPHTTLTCNIVPDFVDDLLDEVQVGDTLHVQGDIGYDVIDDDLRLVSIVGRPDDEGNEEYELGFDDGTITL